MARYTGPKHKLCRRVGECIWKNPRCPANKRPYAPGQHGPNQRKKLSVYGAQLLEKQKIRMHYGINEKQMRKTFKEAQRMGGVTGTNLLVLLETRLDSLVWRMGFANTIFAARQLANHGHFFVDGQKLSVPSARVAVGSTVSVREKSQKIPMIAHGSEHPPNMIPEYIERAPRSFEGKLVANPNWETLPFKADMLAVIGYYSR